MNFMYNLCDGNARAALRESYIGIETGCNPAEMFAVEHYSLNETDVQYVHKVPSGF
jgi:hypothetical protein